MLKYLFFRIFRFQNKIIGEDRTFAALSSVLSISFLLAMNIVTIWLILEKHTRIVLPEIITWCNTFCGTTKAAPIVLGIIVVIPVYFLLYHNKKYEIIIEEIEKNDKRKIKVNNAIVICYQILTIVSLLFVLFS